MGFSATHVLDSAVSAGSEAQAGSTHTSLPTLTIDKPDAASQIQAYNLQEGVCVDDGWLVWRSVRGAPKSGQCGGYSVTANKLLFTEGEIGTIVVTGPCS